MFRASTIGDLQERTDQEWIRNESGGFWCLQLEGSIHPLRKKKHEDKWTGAKSWYWQNGSLLFGGFDVQSLSKSDNLPLKVKNSSKWSITPKTWSFAHFFARILKALTPQRRHLYEGMQFLKYVGPDILTILSNEGKIGPFPLICQWDCFCLMPKSV